MASSEEQPQPGPLRESGLEAQPPGEKIGVGQQMLDKGAGMLQSLKPIKHITQHACSFALYAHDLNRQIQTHHFVSRLNQDFLQSAVYDSDASDAHLIGVEYIVSDQIFETLSPDEQKLWHSHAYEIKSGAMVHPRIPEMVAKPELENLAKTYGKYWCTWQVDRDFIHTGDKLPMGAPALMMSPQATGVGVVKAELVEKRDENYNISTQAIKGSRVEIEEPEWINPQADYWKQHDGKGFALHIVPTDMKLRAPFP